MKNILKKLIHFGFDAKKQYDSCHIGAYSAEAAFFVLVSAVPLVMLAVIMLGAFAPFDIVGVNAMLAQVFTQNVRGLLADFVAEIVRHSTIPLASATMVFLLWSATKGVRSIGQGLGVIYGCCDGYNIVQLTLRSVVYTVAMVVVCVTLVGVLVLAAPLQSVAAEFFGDGAKLLRWIVNMRNIIFFTTLTLLFAAAYKSLAKSGMSFAQQLPGAALASAGWLVFSGGYSVYIRYFSSYSAIYGGFGAVMLFLLWLYMCMNILLCGALFNKMRTAKTEKQGKVE